MNYYNMSISELKTVRDRKLVEYSVKRMDYTKLSESALYIKDKKLMEECTKKMEKIEKEAYTLEDLIGGLNHLIREKVREKENK